MMGQEKPFEMSPAIVGRPPSPGGTTTTSIGSVGNNRWQYDTSQLDPHDIGNAYTPSQIDQLKRPFRCTMVMCAVTSILIGTILASTVSFMVTYHLDNKIEERLESKMKERFAKDINELKRHLERQGEEELSSIQDGHDEDHEFHGSVLNAILNGFRELNDSFDSFKGHSMRQIREIKDNITQTNDENLQDIKELNAKVTDMRTNSLTSSHYPRSCYDLINFGIKASGFYLIDPDGFSIGDGPLRVYCKVDHRGQVETEVLHNTEEMQNVTVCNITGCYHHEVTYEGSTSPMAQLRTLIDSSLHCQQVIEFGCWHAPITDHAFWLDSAGEPQNYFHGSNSSQRICGCFNNGTCQHSQTNESCNCDIGQTSWNWDYGELSNKTALPITGFNYSSVFPDSLAKFRVGRLKCYGRKNFEDEGKSCASLKRMGVSRSDYYLLNGGNGTDDMQIAYCDMTKKMGDNLMQRNALSLKCKLSYSLGAVKYGSIPHGNITQFRLLFEFGSMNNGLANWQNSSLGFDHRNGIFKAPLSGTYMLTFSGTCYRNGGGLVGLYVYVDDTARFSSWDYENSGSYRSCTQVTSLKLFKQNIVYLMAWCGNSNNSCFKSTFFFFVQLISTSTV